MSRDPHAEVVFSAVRIAEILAAPGETPLVPTGEQQAVIEHPLRGSALVIAGAGSGKTETMANRVVWLIANALVEPDQVLGLTFTRKAAGELRERIVGGLNAFVLRLTDLAELGQLSVSEADRAVQLTELLADGLELPEVSTYNSFAAGVLQEFGAAAGIAPGATVIDEATAWRIAREVIVSSDDPALIDTDLSTSKLVRLIIDIERMASDHLTSLDRVDQVVSEFSRVIHLPYNEKEDPLKPSGKVYADVRDAVAALSETRLITSLARAYTDEKLRRGLMDFSDQLSLATRTLERAPGALAVLRSRYRAVLLDEVQDTSVGQTRFLSQIFAGAPVMAVGDPHQSIYAWRGASAEGLQSFHSDFAGPGVRSSSTAGADRDSATLTLSVSWRNPLSVLRAANIVSEELRQHSVVEVPELLPRPGAGEGRFECVFTETVHDERAQVAEWIARAIDEHPRKGDEPPTAAVIFRKRSAMPAFSAALTEAGVPNRIVGLGGLLSTPEVTDVVCVLRCLWYADAGGDLIRLLTGPRFRVGVADLAGLRAAARWFSERDIAQQRIDADDRSSDSVLPDPDRSFTLIDALDAIASMKHLQHRALEGITGVGRERLREAGLMLRALRQGVGGNIADLIASVVHALRLDIELEANEARVLGEAGSASAQANLDTFTDLAEGFLAIDTRGTLASLLEWVERAIEDDEAAEHVAAPLPGTVQLITVHGSKGLQWDIVAVPRLVNGDFPGQSRSGSGWLRSGELPDELRGDAAARPQLNWRIATTQKELKERIAEYKSELRERHAEEERRLAYVAITRSKGWLLLSGSFWGGQTRARDVSVFLEELRDEFFPDLPTGTAHSEDPSEALELTAQWPLDPLGSRASAVFAAAHAVRTELEHTPTERVDEVLELLLAERQAARRVARGETGAESASDRGLPERITASTFHEFIERPEEAERLRLRPIPQRPYRRTRIGNRFHEWVERRATTAVGTALPLVGLEPEAWGPEAWGPEAWGPEASSQEAIQSDSEGRDGSDGADSLDGAAAAALTERELQPLIDTFERSRWANLQPIAVEQEVTLPFAGRTLVCKLDAVYLVEGDGEPRFEVVDWKSGRAPATDAERESRFFQLDLYRHAYAAWAGVAPERIDVTLFYVADNVELRGVAARSLEDLEALWLEAAGKLA